MALAARDELAKGVYTASAGNMAQGVAWNARRLGIPCTVVVPDHAPETKLAAIERLCGEIIKVPFDQWWQVIVTSEFEGLDGLFIHPVSNPDVIAGNGTIGLEILQDLPDVDALVIPYGGGGLSSGIASAIRALKPDTRVCAVEVETAAPLAASLQAGEPVEVEYKPSFVDGIGGKSVLPRDVGAGARSAGRLAGGIAGRGTGGDTAAGGAAASDCGGRGRGSGCGGAGGTSWRGQGGLRGIGRQYRQSGVGGHIGSPYLPSFPRNGRPAGWSTPHPPTPSPTRGEGELRLADSVLICQLSPCSTADTLVA